MSVNKTLLDSGLPSLSPSSPAEMIIIITWPGSQVSPVATKIYNQITNNRNNRNTAKKNINPLLLHYHYPRPCQNLILAKLDCDSGRVFRFGSTNLDVWYWFDLSHGATLFCHWSLLHKDRSLYHYITTVFHAQEMKCPGLAWPG